MRKIDFETQKIFGKDLFDEAGKLVVKMELPLYRLMQGFMPERKEYWDKLSYENLVFLNNCYSRYYFKYKELAAYLFNKKSFKYIKRWAKGPYCKNPKISDLELLGPYVFDLKEIIKNHPKVLSDCKTLNTIARLNIFHNKNFYEEKYSNYYRNMVIRNLWNKQCDLLLKNCLAWDYGKVIVAKTFIEKLLKIFSLFDEVYTKGRCLIFKNYNWCLSANGHYIKDGFVFTFLGSNFSFNIIGSEANLIPCFIKEFKKNFLINCFLTESKCILGLEKIALGHEKYDNLSWIEDYYSYNIFTRSLK